MIVEERKQDGGENNGDIGYTILPARQSGSVMTIQNIPISIISSLVIVALLVL